MTHTPARSFAFSLIAVAGFASLSHAQNALPEDGLFVVVPTPITSEVVSRITNQVESRLNHKTHPVRTFVFDFNPDGKDATNTNFGACYELADYISKKRASTTTVAFVHAKATGHTVLPILACKELVMSKAAVVGEIVTDGVPPLDKPKQKFYEALAEDRKLPFAVVRKMFDKDVQLAEAVLKQGGTKWYIDRRNPEEVAKVAGPADVPFAPPDRVALFSADEARKLGLCQITAETRTEVAEQYNLRSTEVDVLQSRAPDAYRYTLTGEVDGAMRESLSRIIRDIKRKKGNVLILTLNCGGGDLGIARALADDLREAQKGEDAVLIVGFIPDHAPDAATFLAFGCTNIVMSKRHDAGDKDRPEDNREADLGDFSAVVKGGKQGMADQFKMSLRELAEAHGFPGILVDGMFDPQLEIVQVHGATQRTHRRLMSQAEADAAKEQWVVEKVVKPKGQLLRLNATLAGELGIARYTVDTRDPAAVYQIYGLDPAKVKEVTPSWLDRFAEFLKMPVVTVMLVVIGFTGLILELKVPGLTVPGIIAALCFILVFWAWSRFSGEMFVLALLVFILGLILVALEIFVLPGFGAPGIFGILCMLGGLGLVTVDHVPQTAEEWGLLGVKVSQYMFGLIGAFGLAFLIARFLPRVPYANRLLLAPPTNTFSAAATLLPGVEEAAGLLGTIGTANTALRPAGVVRFGERFVDVVSDGGFIPVGTRVQVIAVEGTRIVVKEV